MTPRGLARQYANALFDVANRTGRLADVRRDVEGFDALLSGNDDLRQALASAAIPMQRKKAVLQALLDAAPETTGEWRRLTLLLADRDRLGMIPDVAAAFVERVMAADRVVRAEVTTAAPLEGTAKAALTNALARVLDREVRMTERVDAGIGGGIVAKVGSLVFDGSVARQIERMKEQLLKAQG